MCTGLLISQLILDWGKCPLREYLIFSNFKNSITSLSQSETKGGLLDFKSNGVGLDDDLENI